MDFIKRHYEKVIVIVVLVALIGLAGYLIWKTWGLDGADAEIRITGPKSGESPLDLTLYENVIRQLAQPSLWESDPNAMFRTATPLPTTLTVDKTAPVPEERPIDPVYFERVEREVFYLTFMSYSWNDQNQEASIFQLNYDKRGMTYFIDDVGDTIKGRLGDENTQYVITGFERVLTNVVKNGLPMTEDVSRLTVQVRDEPPITLTKGQRSLAREPVAWAGCQTRDVTNPKIIVKSKPERVRRGSKIVCGTNTYNVIDIKASQMIIVDTSESKTNMLTNVVPPADK
jgi:hypothetical protein